MLCSEVYDQHVMLICSQRCFVVVVQSFVLGDHVAQAPRKREASFEHRIVITQMCFKILHPAMDL